MGDGGQDGVGDGRHVSLSGGAASGGRVCAPAASPHPAPRGSSAPPPPHSAPPPTAVIRPQTRDDKTICHGAGYYTERKLLRETAGIQEGCVHVGGMRAMWRDGRDTEKGACVCVRCACCVDTGGGSRVGCVRVRQLCACLQGCVCLEGLCVCV